MSVQENESSSAAGSRGMRIYELDTSWATTADERRYLHWELLACDEVRGVFLTAREDALVVLFSGDRRAFDAWARTLGTGGAFESGHDEGDGEPTTRTAVATPSSGCRPRRH
jgi:hypothetical protein